MKILYTIAAVVVLSFLAGYLASDIMKGVTNFYQAKPFSEQTLQGSGKAPSDHVKEDQIHVFSDRIVLDIKDAAWSSFTPTGSMIPMFDERSNGIELTPKTPDEIKSGDVISYISDYTDGIIIHRVIETGYDQDGWFAIVQGLNNPTPDPGRVRFSQIEGVLVGIIF